ncbi:unnamed protein product [Paramecium primaurelia]|uniref:Uncharacterized protein n=1 Tax=Paramecium primaurelia TaxID=5886 RepID=A0A8S1MZH6_PARPR|nr:unnamed protein product [Paramecium primaurelia]
MRYYRDEQKRFINYFINQSIIFFQENSTLNNIALLKQVFYCDTNTTCAAIAQDIAYIINSTVQTYFGNTTSQSCQDKIRLNVPTTLVIIQ